jgi:hypothetical protein
MSNGVNGGSFPRWLTDPTLFLVIEPEYDMLGRCWVIDVDMMEDEGGMQAVIRSC